MKIQFRFKTMSQIAFTKLLLFGAIPFALLACNEASIPTEGVKHRTDEGEKKVKGESKQVPPKGVPDEDPTAGVDYANDDADKAVRALFMVMDSFGPTAREDSDRAMAAFLSRGDAFDTLTKIYEESLNGKYDRVFRWKSVFLIGQLHTEESVLFLGDVILSKDSSGVGVIGKDPNQESFHDENEKGHSVEYDVDTEFKIKMTAVSALARAYEKRDLRAPRLVIGRVFENADPEIAQELAVGLFSRGSLSDDIKQFLSTRGIFTEFRRATAEEKKQLFEIDVDDLKVHDGKPVDMTTPLPFPN